MKKIIATVLAMVMALALCTTAFAADPDKYDIYSANENMATTMKTGVGDIANDVTKTEAAAVSYSNDTGSVAYVLADGKYYAKISADKATVNDYVLTSKDGKTIITYLALLGDNENNVKYGAKATAFDKFSTVAKCGYVTGTPVADKTYFLTAAGAVYLAADASNDEAHNYLVDGVVYSAGTEQTVVDHTFKANNYKYDAATNTNIPTGVICTTCLTTSTSIYKTSAIPAGKYAYPIDGIDGYKVVLGSTTPVTPDNTKPSPKTFDAGIAMYVGMALTSVAGSAVVIGKKKEF